MSIEIEEILPIKFKAYEIIKIKRGASRRKYYRLKNSKFTEGQPILDMGKWVQVRQHSYHIHNNIDHLRQVEHYIHLPIH